MSKFIKLIRSISNFYLIYRINLNTKKNNSAYTIFKSYLKNIYVVQGKLEVINSHYIKIPNFLIDASSSTSILFCKLFDKDIPSIQGKTKNIINCFKIYY